MKALNTLSHKLTEKQEQELLDIGILQIEQLPCELSSVLKDLKVDSNLGEIVKELKKVIIDGDYSHLLLPCGSPAFAFLLARELLLVDCKCLFAHSDRKSEEKHITKKIQIVENGDIEEKTLTIVEKINIFSFIKWITI